MSRFLIILLLFCITAPVRIVAQVTDTVIVNNGERRIFGILNRPDGKDGRPLPLVIVAHGFNGDHRFGRNYFEPLAEIGYQCYTLDFPCGSTRSMFDSNTVNMSIRDEQSDLSAVIDYFASRKDVDSSRIVLIGESQGGLVSALTAADKPEKVFKLVLVYPAFCIPDHHNGRFGSPEEIPDTTYVWNVPLGRKFFSELRTMNPYDVIPGYKHPVLLIHGDKDPVVPLEYSQRAAATYPDARLKIIRDAGHGFNPGDFRLSASYITDFLLNAGGE